MMKRKNIFRYSLLSWIRLSNRFQNQRIRETVRCNISERSETVINNQLMVIKFNLIISQNPSNERRGHDYDIITRIISLF
jgi:hypothetical protein